METLSAALHATKNDLIEVASMVSNDKIDIIPFENSWTAGQVLEHMNKAVNPGILYGNTKATTRQPDEKVPMIKSVFLDFNTKMKSPDFILPTAVKHNEEELVTALSTKLDDLAKAANTLALEEECTDFAIPGFGEFTRLEWIWFLICHTQRHTHQLKNIAATLKEK